MAAGLNPNKVPPGRIAAAWEAETGRWLHGLQMLAAAYLAGNAPVQPAAGRVPELPPDDTLPPR